MAKAIVALSQAILNGDDIHSIDYEIINDTYIWIAYQKYTNED